MGIATIDRRLKHEKEVLLINKKNRERNPLLSHQIPVKTSSEFDRNHPGHTQVDFVEQKNWTHVRKMVGYLRYDTKQELEALNNLYRNELRLYKNFFQPIIKLKEKTRINGKIRKKYDKAKTPYQRLMESPEIKQDVKNELTAIYETLNPAELKRQIDKKLKRLNMIYDYKKGRIKKRELDFGVIFPSQRNSISVS